ncbi:MAG: winged helix-turn-helix domain-containing protein [Aquabacterium sp.]
MEGTLFTDHRPLHGGLRATVASAHTIAVLADDLSAGLAWARGLPAEGLRPRVQPARQTLTEPAECDALVLHISGPVAERLTLIHELTRRHPAMPLLVVASRWRDLDRVLALEMGADDTLDDGIAPPLLAARLRALWRRAQPAQEAEPTALRFGMLALDLMRRRVHLGDREVALTEGEFEVLWLLARQAGHVVTREEMLRRLRGLPAGDGDRSIDTRVYRLRAKLGDGRQTGLRTVRNRGYLLSPVGW